jgi:hypothetical protein
MDEPKAKRQRRNKSKKSTKNTALYRGDSVNAEQVSRESEAEKQDESPAKKKKRSYDAAIAENPPEQSTCGKPSHPFEVDDTDHCETPLEAYRDVIPLLDRIAQSLGKTRKAMMIYDPYYCDGGVKLKLQSLGCQNVLNDNEDFYANIATKKIPDYDLLVTNPPYSGEHMEKLLAFVAASKKPYLLLMPHFVYTKDYYQRSKMQEEIFFLVPKSRYSYIPPQWVASGSGSAVLSKGKTQTAPFPSFWYCYAGANVSHSWLETTFGKSGVYDRNRRLQYASSTAHIPRESKGEFDITKKRPNPKARKRAMAAKHRA